MNKSKAGYLEGIISIVINTILFIVKMWAGIVTGSLALMADAWHTLSDSISSVIVVIAAKFSSKKPDRQHPFGHGRWEQIATLLIAFILGIIAFDFLKSSVIHFKDREATQFGALAIVVTVASIVVKEALAQYAFYIGRKSDNLSVKADGWHHRTDALSSVVVLLGILFARQYWWIDSVLGGIISIMIFYATYKMAKEAITKLLGEKPSQELIERISTVIKPMHDSDLQLHHFHIHNYVNHQELTFHIKLANKINIETGHKIATEIENKIHEKFGIIATVHVEPFNFKHESD